MATNYKLYLYLTRRDKKGMQLLSTFTANTSFAPTRVSDIEALNIQPPELAKQIIAAVEANKMLWEPWIEGVENYQVLLQSLTNRGYTKVPLYANPAYSAPIQIVNNVSQVKTASVQLKDAAVARTMLRKQS